jgi:hypothetical protein
MFETEYDMCDTNEELSRKKTHVSKVVFCVRRDAISTAIMIPILNVKFFNDQIAKNTFCLVFIISKVMVFVCLRSLLLEWQTQNQSKYLDSPFLNSQWNEADTI